jgi:hypothetical protein
MVVPNNRFFITFRLEVFPVLHVWVYRYALWKWEPNFSRTCGAKPKGEVANKDARECIDLAKRRARGRVRPGSRGARGPVFYSWKDKKNMRCGRRLHAVGVGKSAERTSQHDSARHDKLRFPCVRKLMNPVVNLAIQLRAPPSGIADRAGTSQHTPTGQPRVLVHRRWQKPSLLLHVS